MYSVKTSTDGNVWEEHGTYRGNNDASSVVWHRFRPPTELRFMRLVIVQGHTVSYRVMGNTYRHGTSMRASLMQCSRSPSSRASVSLAGCAAWLHPRICMCCGRPRYLDCAAVLPGEDSLRFRNKCNGERWRPRTGRCGGGPRRLFALTGRHEALQSCVAAALAVPRLRRHADPMPALPLHVECAAINSASFR